MRWLVFPNQLMVVDNTQRVLSEFPRSEYSRPVSLPSANLLRLGALRASSLVETNRIELSTPCLQGRCSPS